MSLIHICRLNDANPLDDILVLGRRPREVTGLSKVGSRGHSESHWPLTRVEAVKSHSYCGPGLNSYRFSPLRSQCGRDQRGERRLNRNDLVRINARPPTEVDIVVKYDRFVCRQCHQNCRASRRRQLNIGVGFE